MVDVSVDELQFVEVGLVPGLLLLLQAAHQLRRLDLRHCVVSYLDPAFKVTALDDLGLGLLPGQLVDLAGHPVELVLQLLLFLLLDLPHPRDPALVLLHLGWEQWFFLLGLALQVGLDLLEGRGFVSVLACSGHFSAHCSFHFG